MKTLEENLKMGISEKKKFDFECPMCGRMHFAIFNPDQITEYDYRYQQDAAVLDNKTCDFCKTEFTVIWQKEGRRYNDGHVIHIEAHDAKWKVVEKEYYDKINSIENEINELAGLDVDPPNEKQEKKYQQLKAKSKKADEAFEKLENKYEERQEKWREKWEDKLEKMK